MLSFVLHEVNEDIRGGIESDEKVRDAGDVLNPLRPDGGCPCCLDSLLNLIHIRDEF